MKSIERDRIKTGEMTISRLIDAVKRRIADLPHRILWDLDLKTSYRNKEKIRSYRNKHAGERCVIIGNGPSLKSMDLSPLQGEVTFGMNRIYLLFDQLLFEPTYFVSINELVLNQFSDEISQLAMPKFLNWNARSSYRNNLGSTIFLKDTLNLDDGFALDIADKMFSGGTVTYVALQIAYYMGFSEVILIGVDHSFVQKGIPNTVELRENTEDQDHFHPNYFPRGSKWQLPDLIRSEMAYEKARHYFELDGRKILDATVGGKCQAFKKVDFHSVFSG
jgi:hypothetical protein